ncbi:pyruvate, phosphate dikinase (plasmid) [Deltaproteobacteria bacterium Smac51]|nr:pyruvate, phosphate dikinase [Deltaproteobacteria bacterium Smac51]
MICKKLLLSDFGLKIALLKLQVYMKQFFPKESAMFPGRSKAEMLSYLSEEGFPVPALTFFTLGQWRESPDECLNKIEKLGAGLLAVRSSSRSEDGLESSLAGAFESLLNIPAWPPEPLAAAIDEVGAALESGDDQILIQKMAENVIMSGVLMTRSLDDGSPYYVVNYDDASGRTDTVTSGRGVSKTVYVHRGVHSDDFDSPRLSAVVALARKLEALFSGQPLDMEFAVDANLEVHLLQARPICTTRHWAADIEKNVNAHIGHVAEFVGQLMTPRRGLFGSRCILGVMPDWNPAEMIGIHPRPLPLSLYRELITRRVWSQGRELMGYRALPPVELMVSVGGRPYIDARASFNSFLPAGLPDAMCEKLVEAWLDRLDHNPMLHDKVEFEIVPTVLEPGFEEVVKNRYPGLLSEAELVEYRVRLSDLTGRAMSPSGSLDRALGDIERLRALQEASLSTERRAAENLGQFDLALKIAESLEQCRTLGTLPFAVAARHGFIAETWLRGAVRLGVLSPERVERLKRSVKTVSGELTRDFQAVLAGRMPRRAFLRLYGHLRPGAYDLMSPSYREREDLFDAPPLPIPEYAAGLGRQSFVGEGFGAETRFGLTETEQKGLEGLFLASGLSIGAEGFVEYVKKAVAGREYAKFIFTRHLDHILYLVELWGRRLDFSRTDLTNIAISDILSSVFQPLPLEGREYFRERLAAGGRDHALGRSFKLSYLIRSPRDVYIVPQHRSEPNFIGSGKVTAPAVHLDPGAPTPDLGGAIVCIDSADPGYDWIFTRNIAGLVTRYGGTNSHMAIRCAEYGLPAAIGCGEMIFETAIKSERLTLDCAARSLTPAGLVPAAVPPAGRLAEILP